MKLLWPKCHLEVCCLLSKCFGILQLYLLLISSFIPLWSESILILLNLLRCLWPGMWFILVNVPHELDNVYSAAVGGSVLWISDPVDWWYCWVQLCPDLMPAEWQLLIEGYWTLIVDSSISFSSCFCLTYFATVLGAYTKKTYLLGEFTLLSLCKAFLSLIFLALKFTLSEINVVYSSFLLISVNNTSFSVPLLSI